MKQAGDRPVQIGNHYHFFQVNNALQLDRVGNAKTVGGDPVDTVRIEADGIREIGNSKTGGGR